MTEDGVSSRHAIAGSLFALFGLVAFTAPGVAAWLPGSSVVVSVLGLAALALGLRGLLAAARDRRHDPVAVPPVEERTAGHVPGDDFDSDLAALAPDVRDRLREAAVEAIAQRDGVSHETARDRVAAGKWTDDRAAAAFFSPQVSAADAAGSRVRAMVSGKTTEDPVEQAGRTVAQLAARVGVDTETVPSVPDIEPGWRATRPRPKRGPPGTGSTRADGGVDAHRLHSSRLGATPAPFDLVTERWRGVGALTLASAGAGILLQASSLLAVATVCAGATAYAAYGRAGPAPSTELAVSRDLSDDSPAPGDAVDVDVTVRNDGDDPIPDLRYVDGVPPGLEVTAGSARLDARLAPGEEANCSYTVRAESGSHEFAPSLALARDATGERLRVAHVDAATVLSCTQSADSETVPFRNGLLRRPGRITTNVGGTGTEFHSTREYRRGDSMSLVNWNHYARTGELATVQYNEERSTAVVVVVDARAAAYCTPEPGDQSAVRRAAESAAALTDGILAGGDLVGVAALSPRADDLWIPPSAGREHEARIRDALSNHPALSPRPPEKVYPRSAAYERLERRLPDGAEVVVLSPLSDDVIVDVVRAVAATDRAVTVVNAVSTGTDTPGRLLAEVERRLRCSRLRSNGVPVVEWGRDEPLALAVERDARRRGSR